jgi:hypothetical protein
MMTLGLLGLPLMLAFIGSFVIGVLMIIGALKMMRLESHRWAMTVSILALLPCSPAGVIGLVAGIWSLIVLNRPNVVAAFEAQQSALARGRQAGV